jgi:phage shock protein A
MREKVSEEEALADAYGDIANESKSVDDELDRVLDNTSASAESDLDALKKQMGM